MEVSQTEIKNLKLNLNKLESERVQYTPIDLVSDSRTYLYIEIHSPESKPPNRIMES